MTERKTHRAINRLSARRVETLKEPGRHSDGGGLYLVVDTSGAKRWVFIFRWRRAGQTGAGRLREMGLGSLLAVDLKAAREAAAGARTLVKARVDPISARAAKQAIPTFGDLADEVLEARTATLRNVQSVRRWKRCLNDYAKPLRSISVDAITADDLLAVLRPIWAEKVETGAQVRACIEAVLDAAKAKGLRSGENPATYRGQLEHLLPRKKRVQKAHFEALSFEKVATFVEGLRSYDEPAAWALELLILTALRSGEVRGARWDELDLNRKTWTLPPHRMKAGREHRVPLSDRAVDLLEKANEVRRSELVFPASRGDAPIAPRSFDRFMARTDLGEFTVHGFRSSFRDWCGEASTFPRELAEAALAHAVGDETERAYRRGDALEKRRKLMEAWARYAGTIRQADNVVPLSQGGRR